MVDKICTKCNAVKALTEFHVEKRSRSGFRATCKKCSNILQEKRRRERYATDPEFRKKVCDSEKKRRQNSKNTKNSNAEYMKKWNAENKDKVKAIVKKSYEKNRASYIYRSRCRKLALKERTPKWLTELDLFIMECIYDRAKELEVTFGIPFHVDHIIPLQGKTVSGFHCPSNLQILSASSNLSKGNKFINKETV